MKGFHLHKSQTDDCANVNVLFSSWILDGYKMGICDIIILSSLMNSNLCSPFLVSRYIPGTWILCCFFVNYLLERCGV